MFRVGQMWAFLCSILFKLQWTHVIFFIDFSVIKFRPFWIYVFYNRINEIGIKLFWWGRDYTIYKYKLLSFQKLHVGSICKCNLWEELKLERPTQGNHVLMLWSISLNWQYSYRMVEHSIKMTQHSIIMAQNMSKISPHTIKMAQHSIKMTWHSIKMAQNMSKMAQKWRQF